MKKLLLMALAMAFGGIAFAQKTYINPKFNQLAGQHKLVAILPVDARITYKTPLRYFESERNRDKETDLAYKVQSGLYTFLLDRKANTVDFQELDKTNVLLKRAGMEGRLDRFTSEEIAEALGVDAVVLCKYEIEHLNTPSERTKTKPAEKPETTIAPAVITGSAVLTVTINSAESGSLLWRYYANELDYSTFSTMDLVERLTKRVSRNLPYGK